MAGQFELKKSDVGQFMFNLKASNGQIILTSQRYQAKDSAKDGIESVRKHAADDAYFERRSSAGNEPYFVLKAANGQMHWHQRNVFIHRRDGEWDCSVKANAPSAPIADSTV